MTAEQLEELLGKVTPEPWNVSTPVDGAPEFRVIQHGEYGHSDCGRYFCTSGQTSADDAALIALAPSLARRVLAAEKLVEAAERVLLAKPGSFADAEYRLDLDISISAYREASK